MTVEEDEFEDNDNIDHHNNNQDNEDVEKKLSFKPKPNYSYSSTQFMRAFFPIKLGLYIFGLFPFHIGKKANGASIFRYNKFSPSSICFLLTTALLTLVFASSFIGYFTLYMEVKKSKLKDRCSDTWEDYLFRRNYGLAIITMGFLLMAVLNGLFFLYRGRKYLHYFNYWIRVVQTFDMDLPESVRQSSIYDQVQLFTFILVLVIIYLSRALPPINDGAGTVANAFIRIFIQDIGVSNDLTTKLNAENNSNCSLRAEKNPIYKEDYETIKYTASKALGFFIQIYTLYASSSMILQYRFFTHLLRNISFVWNERFSNYIHGVEEDLSDPNKRRLDLKLLWRDHDIIIQMFKLTENAFSYILQPFYFLQIASIMIEVMYIYSQLHDSHHCGKFLDDILDFPDIMIPCMRPDPNYDIRKLFTMPKVWFEDPCPRAEFMIKQEIFVGFIFLVLTLRLTFSTMALSFAASDEAMRAFTILRRHGGMDCRDKHERGFIQSLIVSLARSNPIHITGGNYFVINRTLAVIIVITLINYVIMLHQFIPWELDILELCKAKNSRNTNM